jgi:hypothetical protein
VAHNGKKAAPLGILISVQDGPLGHDLLGFPLQIAQSCAQATTILPELPSPTGLWMDPIGNDTEVGRSPRQILARLFDM